MEEHSRNGTKKTVSTDNLETVWVRISLNVEIGADEENAVNKKYHVLLRNDCHASRILSRLGIVNVPEAVSLQYAVDACRLEILQSSSSFFEDIRRAVDDVSEQIKRGKAHVLDTKHIS